MQLIIDLGNTQIKYFVFDQDRELKVLTTVVNQWESALNEIRDAFPQFNKAILSDVNGSITSELIASLAPIPVVNCSASLRLPFKTQYNPSKQLGADRLALIASAAFHYPNQNVLVIDVGSCITYDFLDREGVHHGGSISPGFSMRYKAMHTFSGKLPLLEPTASNDFLGTNTASAMHAGVYSGIQSEIETMIGLYQKKFGFLTIILTGGDAQRLPKPLKNSIFAHSNFIAKGLNFILSSNIDS